MARTLTREQLRAMHAKGIQSTFNRDLAFRTRLPEATAPRDPKDRVVTRAELEKIIWKEGVPKKEGEKRSAQITFGSGGRQITIEDLGTTVTQAQIRAVIAQNKKARARWM